MPTKNVNIVYRGLNLEEGPVVDGVWTSGRNVRFKPGSVRKTKGRLLKTSVTAGFRVISVMTGNNGALLLGSDKKLFSLTDGLTSVPVVVKPNAGVSINAFTPSFTVSNALFAYWSQPVFIGCLTVVFKPGNFVFKYDEVTKALSLLLNVPGVPVCMMVLAGRLIIGGASKMDNAFKIAPWPTIDDPSSVFFSAPNNPEDWEINLTGKAGFLPLVFNSDGAPCEDKPVAMIARIASGNSNSDVGYVFTDNNLWIMRIAEHPKVFNLDVLQAGFKIFGPRMVCKGIGDDNSVYVMGTQDFYVLNERGLVSLPRGIRSDCFGKNPVRSNANSYAYYQRATREVHFCLAFTDKGPATTDYCYQTETKSWTILDCPYTSPSEHAEGMVAGDPLTQNVYLLDGSNDDDGAAIASFVAAEFAMGNVGVRKIIHEITPQMSIRSNLLKVKIEVSGKRGGSRSYPVGNEKTFDCDTNRSTKHGVRGELLRIKFLDELLNNPWELEGYNFTSSVEDI